MHSLEEFSSITLLDTLHRTDNGVLYRVSRGGRFFVLKVPHDGSQEVALLERLRSLAGIITPVETGRFRGNPATLLPFAQGELLSCIREGRRIQPSAFSCIAQALDQLHTLGVLHRDIHPGNILHVEGSWVLTDLGIARPVGAPPDASHGVVRFSSPAQLRGNPPTVWDDLYSFFLTLCAAFLGQLPWEGIPQAALFLKKEGVPPELPPHLSQILQTLSGREHPPPKTTSLLDRIAISE